MNKIRCEKGHYYDADKYSECPHCNRKGDSKTEVLDRCAAKQPIANIEKTWVINDPVREDVAGKKGSTLTDDVEKVSNSSGEKTESFFMRRNKAPTTRIDPKKAAAPAVPAPPADDSEERTQSFFDVSVKPPKPEASAPKEAPQAVAPDPGEQPRLQDERTQNWFDLSVKKLSSKPMQEEPAPAAAAVSGGDDGAAPAQPEQVSPRQPSEPVVGWLVCTKGERFGECFTIGAGRNSIGRNATNRIAILNDSNISREQHAFVIYEPKGRKFYLQPGTQSGLTYLNRQLVLMPAELKDRDEIGLNESRFLFIPLCNESFSWDAVED